MRAGLKVSAILALMAAFGVHSAVIGLFSRDRWKRTRWRARLISRYSRLGLKVLGVQVLEHGEKARTAALVVGNHLSYVDILILAAANPTCFVTSVEVRDTPGLGHLSRLGSCLFVERRSRARIDAEVRELNEGLRAGLPITVFPEATSTNGTEVLRFRRPLFRAAVEARRPVAPFCLNYVTINQVPVTTANRDTICWYGDMDFLGHLWRLAEQRSVVAELRWLEMIEPPLTSDPDQLEALAAAAHAKVRSHYRPIAADSAQADSASVSVPSYQPLPS